MEQDTLFGQTWYDEVQIKKWRKSQLTLRVHGTLLLRLKMLDSDFLPLLMVQQQKKRELLETENFLFERQLYHLD